jgi:extracellular elastinolytic metalloproteinase
MARGCSGLQPRRQTTRRSERLTRNVDVRSFQQSQLSDERIGALHDLASQAAARLPGDAGVEITRFDATTGNAAAVRSLRAEPVAGDLVLAALRHAYAIAPAFGLAETLREFVPDPAVQRIASGGSVVHLHQHYKGIPVFQAELTVHFTPDRAISETVGSVIAVGGEEAGRDVLAQDAVLTAARHVSQPAEAPRVDQFGQSYAPATIDVTGFTPEILVAFPASVAQFTAFAPGPFGGPITASLLWFPVGNTVHLGWSISMISPQAGPAFWTIVSTTTGEVLYSHELAHGLGGAAYVYALDGGTDRANKPLPADLDDYGVPAPQGLDGPFPDEWLDGDRTEGCFAVARIGPDGDPVAGIDRDGTMTFKVKDTTGDEQKVVNLFYYACLLHDVFYALGFREAEGNFQATNRDHAGVANDRVDARVCLEPIPATARFVTPADGASPVMEMGPVASTGRHCAFDATVVAHEFTHGVSSRIIGGPLSSSALLSPQSAGIAEGLSDFFACALYDVNVVGSWVVGEPGGIRDHPYDDSFPDAFDKIGTGRYLGPHAIGEVCAAILLALLRRIGKQAAMQLIVDAMKLTAANPSFINLRDAVVAAAEHTGPADLPHQVWEVFAKFGLGPKASSNGAQLAGIVADFEPPARDG